MTQGTIIFLNGTSSSGKTSIARALQKSLDEPYLYLSVDSFLDMLPEQCFSGEALCANESETTLLENLE